MFSSYIKRLELRNFPWPVKISVSGGWVRLEWLVPDRDSGGQMCITDSFHLNYDPGFDSFARVVYRGLQSMLKHELDEAFHQDGVRVYDPHA